MKIYCISLSYNLMLRSNEKAIILLHTHLDNDLSASLTICGINSFHTHWAE